ncbi:MAG TPA: RsmE family RNA methyltransferase [Patescibacteria group bacterium]|nr:RsmE family RNA methyltransferase [Patescibacteria group bacterium]
MENSLTGLECLYTPELTENSETILLKGDEARHLKVLRKHVGDRLALTSGTGFFAEVELLQISRDSAELKIHSILKDFGEPVLKIGLALGILENKDRLEFALEKCIELGISEFIPLRSDFAQRKIVNRERLETKAIATIKQCKRSVLPQIHEPQTVEELLKSEYYEMIIFADMEGESIKNAFKNAEKNSFKNILVVAGPEGGFSSKELQLLRSDKRCIMLLLGERRLRAETAAILGVGLLSAVL